MIPSEMLPVARELYRKVLGTRSKAGFSKEQYYALATLKCEISYNKYGGYCVPESSRHRPAARKILANDVYEPDTIEFMRSECGDGDIVHAGTYFGDFLPALSNSCSLDSKVWAFEPNSENYRCARVTQEINGLKNVVLTNAGLGAKREIQRIRTSDENGRALGGRSQILAESEADQPGTEVTQIVSVDEVVGGERTVSMVQLDVEGYEREALTGALDTIRRCRPIIILEVIPDSTLIESDWFSHNILNLGYRKSMDLHGNFVFVYESGG